MEVAGIINNSVVNGVGIRDVLFLQGCQHHCKGCHNPRTWNLRGGEHYEIEELANKFVLSHNPITISGGEPILQYEELMLFLQRVNMNQNKRFWLYTGFRYEELPYYMLKALSNYVDVMVDGPFEEDKKDLTLQFRGSWNQRLIDLPKSVAANDIILWEDKHGEV